MISGPALILSLLTLSHPKKSTKNASLVSPMIKPYEPFSSKLELKPSPASELIR